MADPLSISASVAGLITLADVVIGRSFKYVKSCRSAAKDAARLIKEVQSLLGILRGLHSLSDQIEHAQLSTHIPTDQIRHCEQTLKKIQNKLASSDPAAVSAPLRKLERTLKWPFTSSETEEIFGDLSRYKDTFDLTINMDVLEILLLRSADQDQAVKDVKQIKRDVHKLCSIQISKERRKILDSFMISGVASNHRMNLKLRHPGTGRWLTTGTEFEAWLRGRNSKMWLFGIPGAGKSVLAAAVIDEVLKQACSSFAVSYIYCDYKEPKTQQSIFLLAGLAAQLAHQHERCFKLLQTAYRAASGPMGQHVLPEADELLQLIRQMVDCFDEVAILVDGLDECEDAGQVASMLAELADNSNIKVLISSRDERNIRLELGDFQHVEISAQKDDLQLYVAAEIEFRIQRRRLFIQSTELKEMILDRLVRDAAGMFRWVACQIDHLCDLPDDAARRIALADLPIGLDATYERILVRLSRKHDRVQTLVERVLKWLVRDQKHIKNLDGCQLCTAVAVNDGDEIFNPEAMPSLETILFHCSSLVRLTADETSLEPAHFTVTQFLRAIDPVSKHDLARYSCNPDQVNVYRAKTCLTFLLTKQFQRGCCKDFAALCQRSKDLPFFHHAAGFWPYYTGARNLIPDEMGLLQTLFTPQRSKSFEAWAQMFGIVTVGLPLSASTNAKDDRFEQFMRQTSLATNATPLQYASLTGQMQIVNWLISIGCEIGVRNLLGSPLYCAIVGKGAFGVVTSDEDEDEDETISDLRRTCVEKSFLGFHFHEHWTDTVRTLLAQGAETDFSIDYEGKGSRSVLSLAVEMDCADALLQSGVHLDEQTLTDLLADCTKPSTGLQKLIESVSEENAGVLDPGLFHELKLRQGIANTAEDDDVEESESREDEDRKSSTNRQADLRLACENNDIGVMEYLLQEFSLDVNDPDTKTGSGLLHGAVKNSQVNVVKCLLKYSADANLAGKDGVAPIHLYFKHCNDVDILRILLSHGAHTNIESKPRQEDSAFQLCLDRSGLEEFAILLEEGTVSSHEPSTDRSIWHVIAQRDKIVHYKLLREKLPRSDLDSALLQTDGDGLIPLHIAAKHGSCEVLDLLMHDTPDSSVTAKDGRSVIHFAASCRSTAEPIRQVCTSGLKVDVRSNDGSSALHHCLHEFDGDLANHSLAPIDHFEDVVWLLVECCKSIVTITRHDKTTAMHLLCRLVAKVRCYRNGKCEACREIVSVFKLLLAEGSDLTQGDGNGKSSIFTLLEGLRPSSPKAKNSLLSEVCCIAVDEVLEDYITNLWIEGVPPLNVAASADAERLCLKLIDLGADVDLRAQKTTSQNHDEGDAHSPLEHFCIYGCSEDLSRVLIAKSQRLHSLHPTGKSLLHFVAERKESAYPSIKQLAEAGLDVNVKSANTKRTPLLLAAAKNNSTQVKALLEASAALDAEDTSGLNALSWACLEGSLQAIKILVEHGSPWSTSFVIELGKMTKKEITYESTSRYESTYEYVPTYTAGMAGTYSPTYYGYTRSPRHERKRQYPSYPSYYNYYAEPPPYYDSYLPHYESHHGRPDPRSEGFMYYSPRQYAYNATLMRPASTRHARRAQNAEDSKKKKEIVVALKHELIEKIRTVKYHAGPLELSVFHGHRDITKYLLENSAHTQTVATAKVGIGALFIACWKGEITTARLLVDSGMDINHRECCQKLTPLHVAVVRDSEELVKMLLDAGCNKNSMDQKGRTAVYYALKDGRKSIAKRILAHTKKSREIEPIDVLFASESPWRLASAQTLEKLVKDDEVELLEALVDNGHDVNLPLTCGCTPLLFALHKKRYDVAKCLLKLGASRSGMACEASGRANFTAYHFAAEERERFAVLKALLQDVPKCELSLATSPVHPLHVAVANRNMKAVRHILNRYGELSRPMVTSEAGVMSELQDTIEQIVEAPTDNDDGWGTFTVVPKKKKKKPRTTSEIEHQKTNPNDKVAVPSTNLDDLMLADDDPWAVFDTSTQKRKTKHRQETQATEQRQEHSDTAAVGLATEHESTTTGEHSSMRKIDHNSRPCVAELLVLLLETHLQTGHRQPSFPTLDDLDTDAGDTPLHVAARMGYVDAIWALVEAGAGVDSPNAWYETPLHLATKNHIVDPVKILIDAGGNVNAKDGYARSIAHSASLNGGNLEMLQLLHAHGADFSVCDVYGQTLLHVAAKDGAPDVLHFLLLCGLDISLVDSFGLTALDLLFEMPVQAAIGYGLDAVLGANPEIAPSAILAQLWDDGEASHLRRLIRRLPLGQTFMRANAVSNFLNSTPLYLAALRGQAIVCSLLCQAGALVNLEGGLEGTPLMAACSHGRLEVVKLLVRSGAMMSYGKNVDVISAINAARRFPKILEWLLVLQHTEQGRLLNVPRQERDSAVSVEPGKPSRMDLVFREDWEDYLKARLNPPPSAKFCCRAGAFGSVIDVISA